MSITSSGLSSYLTGYTFTTVDEALRINQEALSRAVQRSASYFGELGSPTPTPIDRTSWHDGSVKVDKVYTEELEGMAALAKREKELQSK